MSLLRYNEAWGDNYTENQLRSGELYFKDLWRRASPRKL